MNQNKKHLKRVKRKRMLERRVKATGTNASPHKFQRALTAMKAKQKPVEKSPFLGLGGIERESAFAKKPKKKGWLSRIFG